MQYRKIIEPNMFQTSRITGNNDNIIGISFAERDELDVIPEIIPWNFRKNRKFILPEDSEIIPWKFRKNKKFILPEDSNSELIEKSIMYQVALGLAKINIVLETNFQISKIYYQPFEDDSNMIYSGLTMELIQHFFDKKELNGFTY